MAEKNGISFENLLSDLKNKIYLQKLSKTQTIAVMATVAALLVGMEMDMMHSLILCCWVRFHGNASR